METLKEYWTTTLHYLTRYWAYIGPVVGFVVGWMVG